MTRSLLFVVALAGCAPSPPTIDVLLRVPPGDAPLRSADGATLSVVDSFGHVLALRRVASGAMSISLDPIPFGVGYRIDLDASFGPDIVARGRSCTFDLLPSARVPMVPVYFSTVGHFAPAMRPAAPRRDAAVFVTPGGRVLLAGGAPLDGGQPLASSERYDHTTGLFSEGSPLTTPRVGARAALLPDGVALIFGGAGAAGAPGIEQYAMGMVSPLATSFPSQLIDEAAAVLGDGRLLVAGGRLPGGPPVSSAMVISARGALESAGPLGRPRARFTLTLSGSDRFSAVFVAGGVDGAGAVADLEIYDPDLKQFTPLLVKLAEARSEHTATLLPSGKLLIVGGRGGTGALASAELLDPSARAVHTVGTLTTPRSGHTATPLPGGRVLIVGGTDASGAPTASAEIYDPHLGVAGGFVPTSPLLVARTGHAALPLCDGTILFVGGADDAEIYNPLP